jgi:hypothetical protein
MDDFRKGQIAAGGRDGMVNIIANAHRFADQTEAAWALVCLAAYDASRSEDGECSDDAIDAWHDGWFAGNTGKPVTECPHFAAGWFEGRCDRLYRKPPIMPERPEGYYHMPLGTFA